MRGSLCSLRERSGGRGVQELWLLNSQALWFVGNPIAYDEQW